MAVVPQPALVLDDREYADGVEVTADEHVTFALNGRIYEMDLSTKNFELFSEDISPWVAVATEVKGGGVRAARKSPQSKSGADKERTRRIREWAIAQGMKVSERGRLPANVEAAYDDAH